MGRCNKENTSKRFRIYNYRSSRRADRTWFLLVTVSSQAIVHVIHFKTCDIKHYSETIVDMKYNQMKPI